MPELPEVESLARALHRLTRGFVCHKIEFFRYDLREPIPWQLLQKAFLQQKILKVFRRSKYLIFQTEAGVGLFHLGMSGVFLCLGSPIPERAHTHVVLHLCAANGEQRYLHFIDPRRFGRIGALLVQKGEKGEKWQGHAFLQRLGIEPLQAKDLGSYLWQAGWQSQRSIKALIMDGHVVVGVGNIYACEALFSAGLRPQRAASTLSKADYSRLGQAIQVTLRAAIAAGGTTFRDFQDTEGKPGYFAQALQVYGRKTQACSRCSGKIVAEKQNGRTSWFCSSCQK